MVDFMYNKNCIFSPSQGSSPSKLSVSDHDSGVEDDASPRPFPRPHPTCQQVNFYASYFSFSEKMLFCTAIFLTNLKSPCSTLIQGQCYFTVLPLGCTTVILTLYHHNHIFFSLAFKNKYFRRLQNLPWKHKQNSSVS